ncbi:MAG: hypothetical protein KAI71_01085 [Candidatus Pacebacteria bacterium]|nr:hypothetical protein [Candidatus Paceibacterota bacterium]
MENNIFNKIIFLFIFLAIIFGSWLFYNYNDLKINHTVFESPILPETFPKNNTSSEISYEDLKQKYIPQKTPEKAYKLELELLSKGMYCYDLPLFDSEWRKKGKEILYSSQYKNTAKKFDISYKVYIEKKYAIIYYPQDKSAGPDFLYKESSGWILDRTAVWNQIHNNYSNTGWFAYEGNYPYLYMLKKIYPLERIMLDNGIWAYRIK